MGGGFHCLNVLAARKTRYTKITKLKGKTSKQTRKAINLRLCRSHQGARLSITYGSGSWDDDRLDQMFRVELDEEAARFIQSLPFFFIATSDKEGNCGKRIPKLHPE